MLRKPVPFDKKPDSSQSQQSIGQSSSQEYSYKNKSSHGYNNQRPNDLNQMQDYENNPTRRGIFNSNEGYLVNETKVKRPTITDGNSPYTMNSASYKLQRLCPHDSGQRSLSRQNVNNNKSISMPNQPVNNKMSQDLSKSIKQQHLVSFGNITNRNPISHSSKKNNPNHRPIQKFMDKQNQEPNSDESHLYDHSVCGNGFYKNNLTKTSTNPSLKNQILLKKQPQSNYLLPIVNTHAGNHSRQSSNSEICNFHSNALSDASSIPSHNQSRISQTDESAYLKQKLIETHSKLIKQLQISKELQDNFFSLKKKYEQAVLLLNQQKSRSSEQINQSKTKQFQNKSTLWNNQNSILTQRVQELLQENKNLKNELTQMSQNMSELILDNQSQKQKQHTLKYSSNDLKQCISQEKIQFNQQISQYNYEKAQYQEEMNKQNNKIQQLKNDLENMRNKVLEMIKEKQTREEQIQSFNEQKNFLQNQLKVLQQKISKKEKQFIQKEELCQIWRKKYSDAQEQSEKVYESNIKLEKQAKQLKSLNHQLNIALRQQKQKNAQMLSQIINIQMQTKQLKSKVSALEQQRKNLKDKLFQSSQQKNLLQQKLQLQHNIQKLTHQYNSLSAIINKKDKQINDLSNEVIEKNNIIHKMTLIEKELEIKEKQLEKRQRDLQDQKISRINSVKDFVNKLEEDKDRNVSMRKVNNNNCGNFNGQGQFTNNILNQGNYQMNPHQQNVIRQNVLNVSSSMRLQSGNATPKRQLSPLSNANNSKTLNKLSQQSQFKINENFNNQLLMNDNQRSLTPCKSLSGLNASNIDINKCHGANKQNYNKNISNGNKILICDNGEEEENQYHHYKEYAPQNYGDHEQQHFGCQNTRGNNVCKYESVEDSLQLVRMINKVGNPQNTINTDNNANRVNIHNHNLNQENNLPKTIKTSKSAQQLHTNKQITQLKPTNSNKQSSNSMTQQKQRNLSSYKEQKQHYLQLLEQIGQLQTQNYQLNQEKKNIIEELDKIESAKTKTKEMIARRRQLELWLLGNQKKNNQIKEKLKIYRGKVL